MKCQYCGIDSNETGDILHMATYHKGIGICLCDRCTDKLLSAVNGRSVDEFWLDKDAIKNGYDSFPPIPIEFRKFIIKRMELMRPVMDLDYRYRKGQKL